MSDYDKKPAQAKAAPTAGPSADDRFGPGKAGKNIEGRILKFDIVDGRSIVTISRGKAHGVLQNMEGYVKGAGGVFAKLFVEEVKEAMCLASVEATQDEITANTNVVINPTSTPRTKADDHTRIIDAKPTTWVDDNGIPVSGTEITVPRGTAHGIASGMRGHLHAPDGAAWREFTIYSVSTLRSYARLTETLSNVTNNPTVSLHAPKGRKGAIQRRATGDATAADAHATAQAGVAGASGRLPHFDTIQRAFGKHDISNVQAQIGGPAADASQALGARAYATGNKVAFASAPDLHTAAHEAAHTIQQARGAVGFQGLGAADDEHERHADAVADAVVAGQSAEPLLDQMANGSSSTAIQRKEADPKAETERERLVDTIAQGFVWFNDAVMTRLLKLESDLKKEDEPDWYMSLAASLLNVALGAGAAGAGVWLAEKVLASKMADKLLSPARGGGTQEFFKVIFENGVNAGVARGKSFLSGGRDGHVVEPFMLAQREAVAASAMANQRHFIMKGQDALVTLDDAIRAEQVFSRPNVIVAAEKQYAASRDAWVSYWAQTKYGAIEHDGVGQKADMSKLETSTTNMQPQKARDKTNKWVPGFVPADAPSIVDAMHGDAPGVLFVLASLPEIKNHKMNGSPKVRVAILNGISDSVRKQYEGRPLGEMNIPRQIVAQVTGAPDFTLNLNERGESPSYERGNMAWWTVLRGTVDHPERDGMDSMDKQSEGRRLLLAELIPSSIKKYLI